MEVNDQNLAILRDLLIKALSPQNETRRSAEEFLKTHTLMQGFPILILTLINSLLGVNSSQETAIRQSAAVLFKNLVKNHWQTEDETQTISSVDKQVIKQYVIEMMTTAPLDVQKQLAEAVTIISQYDFPQSWQNLLPELVAKLGANDLQITKGVMLTVNSIMKRFRYVMKSNDLYEVLTICLTSFAAPLTAQYEQYCAIVDTLAAAGMTANKNTVVTVLESLRLMSRIYYSLNWQDLPEYFEDNLERWMQSFAKFLTFSHPLLSNDDDDDESSEPGPIENLQAAILENLNLFATKYEEEFEPFKALFTQLVWKRLVEIGPQGKYDIIATSAIRFLTSVSSKECNQALFTEAALKDIVQHIVVKNLMSTESDEELFEDNPTDYIRKDMEGGDQDTRRRSAMELVRSLMKFFNSSVSQLCVAYIDAMLENYRVSKDWKAKDAALHLVLSAAVKSGTIATGASELNPEINVLGIFQSHILPELHDPAVDNAPIIKADALKLICVFRSHFDKAFLMTLFPHILKHLQSKYVVNQTYAALCIERFLNIKDSPTTFRITKQDLAPFFQALFGALFGVLVNPATGENEYVMKCIMRSLFVVGEDILPVTELVLSHIMQAFERACKNPVNPLYNHYLFESLALLIRATCGTGSAATEASAAFCARFEALLFPSFQAVLSQDISEFVPYVFQILAQLLAARPQRAGLSDAYRALFVPLLSPALWERKGNIPALIDLYKAYISRGMAEIIAANNLTGVLGVFQKLLASKATESHAFNLLNVIFQFCPMETLSQYLTTIFNLLLHRMQESMKTNKNASFCKMFVHSISLFSVLFGAPILFNTLEKLTPGLVPMIVTNVWLVNQAQCCAGSAAEVKHMVVGGTKLLVETPLFQQPQSWLALVQALIPACGARDASASFELKLDEVDQDNREFDGTYSKLAYASINVVDACVEIPSASEYFAKNLWSFIQSQPGAHVDSLEHLDPQNKATLRDTMRSISIPWP